MAFSHSPSSSEDSDSLYSNPSPYSALSPYSTSPSSVASDLWDHEFDSKRVDVQYRLPSPFIPPSISQSTDKKPRPLPHPSGLPDLPAVEACSAIDPQDIWGPDYWVPRDPRMLRLTGKHPFNSEAKLKDLFEQGFITPSNLFFVRNHGAVPQIDAQMPQGWKVQIHGHCANPISLSINDLMTRFKVVTIPVTLVCAGNRRKEQNIIQKSVGFSWGSAGLSTALFTGVWLADVLDLVRPTKAAKHIIFEGVDKLPNGPYGTSQLLSWARDPRKGMMLAWAMNGVPLEPDHGFPLRLLVPGQIGGRSVKWLHRIELSQNESQHHLHFHDNKLLPMAVGPDQARAEVSWWHDPRYIIRDLNVNSAVACPNHDEVVDMNTTSSYVVKGYAYSGGGRRITRVEITLDGGKTWKLADMHYPEDQFKELAQVDPVYGHLDLTESDQCFCWSFWSLEIPLETLKDAPSLAVRAVDESLARQPQEMYWSATGMMNNWWFRVLIHQLPDEKLRFEHPAPISMKTEGWMQRLKDQGQDPAAPELSLSGATMNLIPVAPPPAAAVPMTRPEVNRKITIEEFTAQAKEGKPWFVVKGEVYDAADYLDKHPGGPESITMVAGEDVTDDFMAIHSAGAKRMLAQYHIGTLVGGGVVADQIPPAQKDEDGPFIHPKTWKSVSLVSVEDVSSDTKIFRFTLARSDQHFGLPTGQHVYIRLKRKTNRGNAVVGEMVQRAYTPLSRETDKGFIDVLVKIYYPNDQYPSGGRMTLGFSELAVGDSIDLKGPIGHFIWQGRGVAKVHGEERNIRHVGMVCAGSGITPILQVLRGIFEDPTDESTMVSVLDINRHLDDILCKDELDGLAGKYPLRFRLRYSLTGSPTPEGWLHSTGRVDEKMLQEHLPARTEDGIICICGPPPMENFVKASLISRGWNADDQIVIF